MGRGSVAALLLAVFVLLSTAHPATADSDTLWHIIHDQCVPDQRDFHSPKPCELVDLSAGYVVLKDMVGNTQFLLMPTARITGIESPSLLAPNAPNYFAQGWQARHFVEQRGRHQLPRNAIGLAVNSMTGRTQNQLHIHIDCMRLDVIAALRDHATAIGPQWAKFPVTLAAHPYLAMRLVQPELGTTSPFVLLADGVPGARADMAHWTLVVVGDSFQGQDGFVLLAGHAEPAAGNWGSGEQLQDHACAAATFAAR